MELGHAARSGSDLAVMFLDLDSFKVVNDGMGHQAGDELLQAVATRFLGVVRAGETVARLGGDEFTFIFHDVRGPEKATEIANRILGTLSEPIVIHGRTMVVTGQHRDRAPRPRSQAARCSVTRTSACTGPRSRVVLASRCSTSSPAAV